MSQVSAQLSTMRAANSAQASSRDLRGSNCPWAHQLSSTAYIRTHQVPWLLFRQICSTWPRRPISQMKWDGAGHNTRINGSPSPPRRVRSPEDRIQSFVAIMSGEATKGSGAPDEILTYRYVKPWVQWFPNEEDHPIDPFRIVRGLEGYVHRACSRAPSNKETQPIFTWPRPPPRGARLSPSPGHPI